MRRLYLVLVFACFAATACDYSYKKPGSGDAASTTSAPSAPPPPPEELAAVRNEAFAEVTEAFWPFYRKEYVVMDATFVDPCILDIIHTHYGYDGGIPTLADVERRKDLATFTGICWREKLVTKEGIARIEPLVKERYEHPVITRDGYKVTLDMGVVPGHVLRTQHGWRVFDSPVLDAFHDWNSPEAVRVFKMAIEREPTATRYVAVLDNGNGSENRRQYTYDRKADVIQLEDFGARGETIWVTEPLHGDVANVKTLERNKLHSRTFAMP